MSKIFSYLPVIYKKSNITKMLSNSLDLGLDGITEYLADVILQLNPYTVTWGLSYWESEYDITPSNGDTFDIRKARVLAFFNKDNRYSTKGVQTELKRIYGIDSNIHADCENYIVNITLDYLLGMKHSAVYEYLNAVFPAHLLLKFVIILTTQKNSVFYATAQVTHSTTKLFPSFITGGESDARQNQYIGTKQVLHSMVTIGPNTQDTFDGFN